MKRTLLFLLFGLLTSALSFAALEKPTVSTSDHVVWYYITFASQENVLTEQGDGQKVKTAGYRALPSQQWKVEGDAKTGYTLTSKTGRKLYVNKAIKTSGNDGYFFAATSPTSKLTVFSFITTTNGKNWLIAPKSNTSIFMNQYGGAGAGKDLGLWIDRGDAGSALYFQPAEGNGVSNRIIPAPSSIKMGEGKLQLSALTAITYPTDSAKTLVEAFAAQLEKTSGIKLTSEATGASRKAGAINLAVDATLPAEGYKLTIDKDGVSIAAAHEAGFFYAVQTIKQLLPNVYFGNVLHTEVNWQLPFAEISDAPRFGHRGYMLDVARHFFDKNEVKRIIDIISFYKLNRLHWHLTDDQGWRVQIPEYPRLTEVGAVRSGSFVSSGGSPAFYDDTEYGQGMFYTLDDLKEIVAYAKERNVEIMPEIDLPGHMVAAIASYPSLSCDSTKKYEVRINGGISHDVLNVGDDKVIDFLKCVLGHIAETFPFPLIHIGGDECPTENWVTNADCQRRIKEEGLSGVDGLQPWLVEELGTFLKEKYNKDIVVWDELLKHWNKNNSVKPVVMAWNSINLSASAADNGFKSIVVPYQSLYFDMLQVPVAERRADEKYVGGWGNGDNYVNSLPKVYGVNPAGALSGREQYCLGVQGNMWTETCNNNVQLEYQLLPRLLALSEIGWNPADKKTSFMNFLNRMQGHAAILDSLHYTYAKHYFFDTDETAADSAITASTALLKASVPGTVGHVTKNINNALQKALDNVKADKTNTAKIAALQQAITDFKAADVVMPTEGKIYQLISASTDYLQLYNGSTAYESNGQLRIHYTPQTEPEELWQFVKTGNGYDLRNYLTGHTLSFNAYNANVSVGDKATAIRIDKAVIPYKECQAVPGALLLSDTVNYSAAKTGSIKRLYADRTGYVKTFDDPTLTFPGNWRIIEVTDYKAQLTGLVKKSEKILREAIVGEYGQPTQEALDMLKEKLVTPANKALEGNVDEAIFKKYTEIYAQFDAMPRTSYLDAIDEKYYYRIRPDYANFTAYYAKANTSLKRVVPAKWKDGDDTYIWIIRKLGNGKIQLFNKANGQAAYVSSFADGTQIALGTVKQATSWNISYTVTTEAKGANIGNGTISWYTNPNSFPTLILKPNEWGGSMWVFERTDEEVPTSVTQVETNNKATGDVKFFDLNGRKVAEPTDGIYVTNDGRKIRK